MVSFVFASSVYDQIYSDGSSYLKTVNATIVAPGVYCITSKYIPSPYGMLVSGMLERQPAYYATALDPPDPRCPPNSATVYTVLADNTRQNAPFLVMLLDDKSPPSFDEWASVSTSPSNNITTQITPKKNGLSCTRAEEGHYCFNRPNLAGPTLFTTLQISSPSNTSTGFVIGNSAFVDNVCDSLSTYTYDRNGNPADRNFGLISAKYITKRTGSSSSTAWAQISGSGTILRGSSSDVSSFKASTGVYCVSTKRTPLAFNPAQASIVTLSAFLEIGFIAVNSAEDRADCRSKNSIAVYTFNRDGVLEDRNFTVLILTEASKTWWIVLSVIGGIAVLALIGGLLFYFRAPLKRKLAAISGKQDYESIK